jgi:hypothetical protein
MINQYTFSRTHGKQVTYLGDPSQNGCREDAESQSIDEFAGKEQLDGGCRKLKGNADECDSETCGDDPSPPDNIGNIACRQRSNDGPGGGGSARTACGTL